jgi:hypothetical protein
MSCCIIIILYLTGGGKKWCQLNTSRGEKTSLISGHSIIIIVSSPPPYMNSRHLKAGGRGLLYLKYHGWRKQWIIHQGWESAYAARSLSQYISAFATRVLPSTYVCVKGERAWARIFKLFMTPGINSTELVHWSRKPFILLLHSHYYIWFHGHFYTP